MRSYLLIYGVTGHTGRLVSRLAAVAGLPHVAAGRDLERVAAHADPLLLPSRTFSLSDPARVDRGLDGIAVVLNAAGPFADSGPRLAEACLRCGSHYLDLAGEAQEIEAIRRLDARAREAGVMLMPGAGLAVVPTDALAARLRRRLPAARHLRLAVEAGGTVRGRLRTLLRSVRQDGFRRRDGELVPARPAEERLRVDLGSGPRTAVTDPWRGDVVTAYWSSVYQDIDTFAVLSAPWIWLLRAARWAPLRRLLAGPRLQELLRRLPPGPREGEGEEGKPAHGLTRIWAQAEDRAGHQVTARLRGPEAHLFSARSALWIAQRALAGRVRVGFQTPVTAYGPDLIDRLAAEIEGVEVS
jgi:short subunit dehydrogenase-like uncharacterized protein